jgi:hypothetical protein
MKEIRLVSLSYWQEVMNCERRSRSSWPVVRVPRNERIGRDCQNLAETVPIH